MLLFRKLRLPTNVLREDGLDRCCLLHQSVKQLATRTGRSTVEPKRVFIEVVIEMRRLDPTLVSSQQPAFDQGNNLVDLGQHILPDGGVLPDDLTFVAESGQSLIASPSIGLDSAARLHTLFHSTFQAGARRIRYTPESNPCNLTLFKLYHDNNQRFARCSSTALPRFLSAYVDLICLNCTRKTISSWTHHSASEFVKHSPGAFIVGQIKNTLHSQCVHTVFLSGQVPNSPKPQAQRLLSILKDRTRRNGGLEIAVNAPVQTSLCRPRLLFSTTWAPKARRPPKFEQILNTCVLSGKTFRELEQSLGIVLHTWTEYTFPLRESSGYAYNLIRVLTFNR